MFAQNVELFQASQLTVSIKRVNQLFFFPLASCKCTVHTRFTGHSQSRVFVCVRDRREKKDGWRDKSGRRAAGAKRKKKTESLWMKEKREDWENDRNSTRARRGRRKEEGGSDWALLFKSSENKRLLCAQCWESEVEPGLRECLTVYTDCIPAMWLQDAFNLYSGNGLNSFLPPPPPMFPQTLYLSLLSLSLPGLHSSNESCCSAGIFKSYGMCVRPSGSWFHARGPTITNAARQRGQSMAQLE